MNKHGSRYSKRIKAKACALIASVAIPGMVTFSCSGSAQRQFRDAAFDGAANFVQTSVFEILEQIFPIRNDQA